MKNKYVFFFYIIILIISSTKLVAYGNNLGFGYSDYGYGTAHVTVASPG